MIQAVIAMFIAGLTIAIVFLAMQDARETASSRATRNLTRGVASDAIEMYQRALALGFASESNMYYPSTQQMNCVLTGTASTCPPIPSATCSVSPTAAPSAPTLLASSSLSAASANRFNIALNTVDGVHVQTGPTRTSTVIQPFPYCSYAVARPLPAASGVPSRYALWQIYRIDLPSAYVNGGTAFNEVLAVYFRSWTASQTGQQITRPQYQRVEFRNGMFSDYQLLTDSTTDFAGGAAINGPVHSNGTACTLGHACPDPLGTSSQSTIRGLGNISCSGQVISTAVGRVQQSRFPGCNFKENSDSIINILRAGDSFTAIRQAGGGASCSASAGAVRCLPWNPQTRRVLIDGSNVAVQLPSGTTWVNEATLTLDGTGAVASALLIASPTVIIQQGTRGLDGRLTVAASAAGLEGRSAEVLLNSNLTLRDPQNDSLGIISEGNIVINFPSTADTLFNLSQCISNIQAALVSLTGGVRLPSGMLAQEPNGGQGWAAFMKGAMCPRINIFGSIAAHNAPILIWNTPQTATESFSIGWTQRTYSWNSNLRTLPPPYFPKTERWSALRSTPANELCLFEQRNDWSCK